MKRVKVVLLGVVAGLYLTTTIAGAILGPSDRRAEGKREKRGNVAVSSEPLPRQKEKKPERKKKTSAEEAKTTGKTKTGTKGITPEQEKGKSGSVAVSSEPLPRLTEKKPKK